MSFHIYTDGSCIKSNIHDSMGFGGWSFQCFLGTSDWRFSGGDLDTTNNRMELTAVIEALEFTHTEKEVIIFTDSKYVIECARGTWTRKKNQDLWLKYDIVSKKRSISWKWIKSHNGNKYNEIVDKLANNYANELKINNKIK
jgi:ribonuclease HI